MTSTERLTQEVVEIPAVDIEAALDPVELDGVYRDSRECAGTLLPLLLLSPPTPRPTPRPKKG
ncbi:hypothetical protein J7E95_39680 [Streptomyces sp. ISL-14]|nr:hypothetical protein [Streptomyces sp. ISL-14]